MADTIVRNPTPGEVEKGGDIALAAFGGEREHWQKSFHNIAELFGERFILVVEADGELISSLLCTPGPVYMGEAAVPHSAVGGVGTIPEYRQKGYAGLLMSECVRLLRREGIYISSLWPFSYEYYRKFGWEIGAETRNYSAEAKVFLTVGDPDKARGATLEDFQQLQLAYDLWATNYNCLTQRSDTWWRRIIKMPDHLHLATEPGLGVVVQWEGGHLVGYAGYEMKVNDEGVRSINVKEIMFFEPSVRRNMLALLATLIGPEERINFVAPLDDHFLHELPNPRLVTTTVHPSFQFRVIDPEKAMLALQPMEHISGRLSISLTDPVFEQGFDFGLEIEDGEVSLCKPDPEVRMETDILTLAKLYTGYLSALDAVDLGKIPLTRESVKAISCASEIFSELTPFRSGAEPG